MDDKAIIELFFARSERAIEELHTKYGNFLRQLSYRIVSDYNDAEECVNEAYLGVWNSIPPEHPAPLLTYVCKIVRNISVKRFSSNTAVKRDGRNNISIDELSEYMPSSENIESDIEAKELANMIECFLESLSTENRVIFMRRYWFYDSYGDIAKRTGLREKTVSVRLVRLRKNLAKYLKGRGISI